MNAKPNVPDYQHALNREEIKRLQGLGFRFEITSSGYQVWKGEKYLCGASTGKKCHGRYREANLRDFTQTALSVAKSA